MYDSSNPEFKQSNNTHSEHHRPYPERNIFTGFIQKAKKPQVVESPSSREFSPNFSKTLQMCSTFSR